MGFFEQIFFVFISGVALAIIIATFTMVGQSKKAKVVDMAAESLADRMVNRFPTYRHRPSIRGDTLVLIMDPARRMALVGLGGGVAKEIPFDLFLTASIEVDGRTVSTTVRNGILGRAVVGGVIVGGVGAIVGAATASSIQNFSQNVTGISFVLYTSDPEFPSLSWAVFQPYGLMQDLKPYEVRPYLQTATALYNQAAPIFALVPTSENGMVAI